ncbi:flagellar biosynthesis anti-sigma factor FlgM [Pseudothauera lacus]|uniref:Negative regulator of flagellin synthesis n=1 Tax=Pseudothauera lacus TaxID=2136175 RepID=A0A2T4IHT0_9RHOO|nr:flagellar biosynthesis anti-sigma factor FlgM [Pseudothauera lacus]PTD97342.1 flagellar biosynthesis anti-sigma factor FlgM [Pseudothauera lacus]
MKIEGAVKSLGGLAANDSKPRPQSGQGQAAPAAGDKVQISSLSSSLQKAEAAISAAPVVDSQRVAEIRQAISEGRFKVDADRIADGLLDSVREFLGDARSGAGG